MLKNVKKIKPVLATLQQDWVIGTGDMIGCS